MLLFPAWAGVIPVRPAGWRTAITFPRVGGGDPIQQNGTLLHVPLFPAWAGVIPADELSDETMLAFPRVGGGDPDLGLNKTTLYSFSPRGRG